MSFDMKTLEKSNLNIVWGCYDYTIQKYVDSFRFYNLKPPRLGGL